MTWVKRAWVASVNVVGFWVWRWVAIGQAAWGVIRGVVSSAGGEASSANHAKRLKTVKGLTPAQLIWKECKRPV